MEEQTLLPVIMIFALMVGCYFGVLRALMQRAKVQNALPMVAGILLVLFALAGITLAVIASTMGAELVLLALIVMIALVTLCAAVVFLVQNFHSLHRGMLALLVCYLLVVAYITVFSRSTAGDHRISLLRTDLFVKAIQMHSLEPLHHVFLNIAMFMPVGFLLPLVQPKKLAQITHAVFLSMTLSIMIETTQLMLQIGQADLTDVIANTLGGMAGYLVYKLFRRFAAAKDDPDRDFDER